MSASDTYVLADNCQEALKLAYVLAEQRQKILPKIYLE